VGDGVFGSCSKSLSRRSVPAVSLTICFVMGWIIVICLCRNGTAVA